LWLERVPRVLTIDKGGLKAVRTWRPLTLAAVLTAEEAGEPDRLPVPSSGHRSAL